MASSAQDHPWQLCYEQLAPKLLLFARQWLPAAADAEDAVQAAFVKFWQRHPDAGPANYPLLFAAVRTSALDLLRGEKRRALRELSASAEEQLGGVSYFAPALEQREEAQRVQRALATLPTAQREVLVLRVWGELTFAEIAATLGESINTVAARHRYALEALRKTLHSPAYERLST